VSSRQDLIRKFQELQDRIHTLMEDAVIGSHSHGRVFDDTWSPLVDAYETGEEFVLAVEIPGVEQNQIDLQITNHVLSIRGQRNPCSELSKQVFYRLERPSGSFERQFTLPEDVDTNAVQAKLNAGVLTVTLPKTRRRRPFKVEVKRA
jgi:HSP20 family protein